MRIPISILMDKLVQYKPESYIADKNISFSVVNVFPSRARTLSKDHLYVGKLSEVFNADWRGEEICCIAIRDRLKDEDETPERLKNIMVLNFNCDPMDIFADIQRCFFKIIEWNERMKDYIISNRSMQDVLALSEDVIGNYITISDSALGLMAHTSGLTVNCPVTNALVKNGYHNEETLALFNKYRLPEIWAKSSDIYVNSSRNFSPYPNVCKVIRYNNNYFAHAIMVCNNSEPSDGLIALFRMLLDHLMICFERQWSNGGGAIHAYDNLIATLTEKEMPPDILKERAANCGLPVSADFRFLKICPQSSSSVILQRMSRDITSNNPDLKATVLKDSLVILMINKGDGFDDLCFAIEQQLERCDAYCGISNPFNNLNDVNFANIQADIALKYGSKKILLPFSANTNLLSRRIHFFETYYPYHLMCGTAEAKRLSHATNAHMALKKLEDYDNKHGSNNVELLYVYLSNDRKATETAAVMHMHRNNVIYRVNRICDIINMDLEDNDIRFRLLLAYEVYSPKSI